MASKGDDRTALQRLSQIANRNAVCIGVLVLVAIVWSRNGVDEAALFLAASVIGYWNAFKIIRPLAASLLTRSPAYPAVLPIAFCALGSSLLVWLGYWESLAMITLSLIAIDAIVLRFGR